MSGEPNVARRRLSWLRGAAKARYVPPSQFAACWLGLGQPDRVVQSLEQAAEERDPLAVWFYAYPFFRHLRGHAGFERLVDRIGVLRYQVRTPA